MMPTNTYLKNSIENMNKYLKVDDEVPEELFIRFIRELDVSNLILPGIIEGENISFEILSDEDESVNVVPIFTDLNEFNSYYSDECEFNPVDNEIGFYTDLLKENNLDAILINPGNDDFLLEKEILVEIPLTENNQENDGQYCDVTELYELSKNVSNDSLVDFITSGNDHFEELMLELSSSNLLNLIASEKDLSTKAQNGIINLEGEDFAVCTSEIDNHQYGILFTSRDNITEVLDEGSDLNYYYQLTLLDEFMEFILKNDMSGIIINPGLDDYLISREYLLEAYGGLTYDNKGFKKSSDYAFI